jgi:hypothetical protein
MKSARISDIVFVSSTTGRDMVTSASSAGEGVRVCERQ